MLCGPFLAFQKLSLSVALLQNVAEEKMDTVGWLTLVCKIKLRYLPGIKF